VVGSEVGGGLVGLLVVVGGLVGLLVVVGGLVGLLVVVGGLVGLLVVVGGLVGLLVVVEGLVGLLVVVGAAVCPLHVELEGQSQILSLSFHSKPAGQGITTGVPVTLSALTVH